MSNINDYDLKLESIKAIPEKDVKQPHMPMGIFIQEGENTCKWCLSDKDALIAKGLDWSIAEGLTVSLGALREAHSRWNAERHKQEEAAKSWSEKAPLAYDLRNTLLHDFRFAFRKVPSLLSRVNAIAAGAGHADMIQDLNDLSVLGKQNTPLFANIDFDINKLEIAADFAAELGELLAKVNGSRHDQSELKTIRDKAYTICKDSLDEIRACGQYALWRNSDRIVGYASDYVRKHNKQRISDLPKTEAIK
jgi:hypothetical protein